MLRYPSIDPVVVALGGLEVRWYGLMYLVGFASAWILGKRRASLPGSAWSKTEVDDLITYLVVGLIVGARLGYALFYDFSYYLENPLQALKIWRGGMSFHGGAVGVALAAWLFAKKRGKTILQVGDFLTPLAPPGLMAGRLGNFINGELWGRETTVPWGMALTDEAAANGGPLYHPSQLYEAAGEGIILFAILWIYSSRPREDGRVSGLFLIGYGLIRFSLEFFRQPDVQLGFIAMDWLTMGQLLCLPMILIGAWLMLRPKPA